jgi:hypothetical protein
LNPLFGVVGFAVADKARDKASGDEATRESVIARIAKAAWDWASWAQQPATK